MFCSGSKAPGSGRRGCSALVPKHLAVGGENVLLWFQEQEKHRVKCIGRAIANWLSSCKMLM